MELPITPRDQSQDGETLILIGSTDDFLTLAEDNSYTLLGEDFSTISSSTYDHAK